jgi:hypothetical protein
MEKNENKRRSGAKQHTTAPTAVQSSRAKLWRNSRRMKMRMNKEMAEKIKAKVVPIKMMPVWSVAVMIVTGGDCPGYRPPAPEPDESVELEVELLESMLTD